MKNTTYPLVTFTIASHNHSQFIVETLDSILNDSYPNKEIVIIDDGSTDGSPEIIEKWIKNSGFPKISFKVQPNRGLAKTLNLLVESSSGEFIRLCSSDDVLLPDGTVTLVQNLSLQPDKSAIFGDGLVIDSSGDLIAESIIQFEGAEPADYAQDLAKAIISRWAVSGPVILFRKSAFLGQKPYAENLVVEDWYLYVKLAAKGAIAFVPDKVVKYRLHSHNTSKTLLTPQRCQNIESQLVGARLNAENLKGSLKVLLLAEIMLLNAKLCYLRKAFVRGAGYLIFYAAIGGTGRIWRKLSSTEH